MPDRERVFRSIKSEYAELERRLKSSGKGLVYRTAKGIYGTSDMDNIFQFFRDIRLHECRNFIDLGCGDGRVVLMASLFTKATGIEFDPELISIAEKIQDTLKLDAELIQGDYLSHDISKYDVVFINPDHGFRELGEKLRNELNGTLFIYNDIFAPDGLSKGKKFWYGQVPIIKYTRKD